jgi:hypothetical protein
MDAALARIPALYRVQLRTARYFDRNPALKTLLALPGTPLIAPTPASPTPAAVKAAVRDFTAPSEWYAPPRSLYDYVRRRYNAPLVIGDEGEEAALSARLDVAFNAQRALVYVADLAAKLALAEEHGPPPSLPASLQALDLREAEAGLSPGCLLVEHPSATRPGRSLIYVYDVSQNLPEVHGNDDWVVRGYAVNRPFPSSVATMTRMPGLGPFGEFTLFHGGGDDERLAVLHTHGDIEGAAAVNEEAAGAGGGGTLYVGGSVEAMNAKLAAGTARPGDFKVLVGSVQLRLVRDDDGGLALAEPDRYAFVTGPGVNTLALQPALFDTTGKFRDGHGLGTNDVVKGYNYARFWHQNATWSAAVRALAAGMDPGGTDASWREVAAWANLHAGVTHIVQAALPLPHKPYDAAVQAEGGADAEGADGAATEASSEAAAEGRVLHAEAER